MSATASTSRMANHKEFKIGGLSVLFPCKPYPSQFSMMDKIIRGIERQQNCLLESPTGSGKSLALLCSALAWQAQERLKQQEMANQAAEDKDGACCCICHCKEAQPNPQPMQTADSVSRPSASSTDTSTCKSDMSPSVNLGESTSSAIAIDNDSDDEFKPLTKFRPGKSSMVTRKKRKPLSIEYEDSPSPGGASPSPFPRSETDKTNVPVSASTCVSVTPCSQCSCGKDEKTPVRKVPRIYFGTRTHKQVAQIVRELRKTAYHDVTMTILASREHTCIHPEVSCAPNKNEGCENLIKEVGCRFKDRVMKFQSQYAIKSMGLASAWDLEDMVSLMKSKKACPYFLTRGLKDQSDLIICPYNYLVDPLIRESMEINLKDQIVLLDEAHNIEDAAREAASQSFTKEQIQRALHNMDELMERNIHVADISKLRQMCHKLDTFIQEQATSLTQLDFDQAYRMWSGFEIVAQLRNLDLGAEKYPQLAATLTKLKTEELEEKLNNPGQDHQGLSSVTGSLLESLFLIMKYIYKDNMKHAEDYRASIVKSVKYMPADHNGSWMNSRRHFGGRRTVPVEVLTLNFWCMNPAVGFADFGLCRSVILTSGTLSPMDSFQSELGLPFPIVLEAYHVIKDSQVWVGAIGEGPNGTSLQAVYRNMETFDFQDQLGQLILGVCKKVPKGVLCFLPSYKAMEKLSNRWKTTGLWKGLEAEKRVFLEPRGSDKADFELVMLNFVNTVNRIHINDEGEEGNAKDGALLFAVCRGKVSEGMDFADNSARAVITVGIPYPNFKDIQVELKRKYNDQYQASRRLLSGHLWYEIQAFRALNQALGRCIRHRRDWGALIIVDDRFVKNTNKYANGLSKWVRQKLHIHRKCGDMFESLAEFTATRLEEQQQDESLDSSMMSPTLTPASQPGQYDLPRAPLHDVSNFRFPSATSTPLGISSPLITGPHAVKDNDTTPHMKNDVTPKRSDNSESETRRVTTLFGSDQETKGIRTSPASATATSAAKDLPLVSEVSTAGKPVEMKVENDTLSITRKPVETATPSNAMSAALKVSTTAAASIVSTLVNLVENSAAGSNVFTASSNQTANGVQALKDIKRPNLMVLKTSTGEKKIIIVPSSQTTSTANPLVHATAGTASAAPSAASEKFVLVSGPGSKGPGLVKMSSESSGGPLGALHLLAQTAGTYSAAASTASVSAQYSTSVGSTALYRTLLTTPTTTSQTSASNISTTPMLTTGAKPTSASPALNAVRFPGETVSTMGSISSKSVTSSAVGGGINPNLSIKDPTLPPTMMILPSASTSQQLILVPPQFQLALGRGVFPVPPMIQHIVMAHRAEQANQLFLSSLQKSLGVSRSIASSVPAVSSAGVQSATPQISKPQGSTPQSAKAPQITKPQGAARRGVSPQWTPLTKTTAGPVSSQLAHSNSAITAILTSPRLSTKAVTSPSASTGSPALFDDTPPLQSPYQAVKSLLLGKTSAISQNARSPVAVGTVTMGALASMLVAKSGKTPTSTLAGSDTAQKDDDDDVICAGVSSLGQASETAATETAVSVTKAHKKLLFRNTPCKGSKRASCQSSLNGQTAAATAPGSSTSAASSSNAQNKGVVSGSGAAEEGKVSRRVRGSKRRSLSMGESEMKKGRQSDADDGGDQEEAYALKCAACSYILLGDLKTTDYERRETMPSFLKGMTEMTSPEVLYFYGASVSRRLKVAEGNENNIRRQPWPGGLEASVQLIHCPQCRQPSNPATVLGARVTLSDPKTSTSTGQMWIYSHTVIMARKDGQ